MVMELVWPLAGEPTVSAPFDPETAQLTLAAPPGTPVFAAATGTVNAIDDHHVQVTSPQFVIVYSGLQAIQVQANQSVAVGAPLAQAGAEGVLRLSVYRAIDPTGLFEKRPESPAPPPKPEPPSEPVRLTTRRDGLRVREAPVDGRPVGTLKLEEVVESLEPAAITARKVGIEGEWLHIRRSDGTDAYAAAWFLQTAPPLQPVIAAAAPARISRLGMNLDIFHPRGHPDAAALQGIGWVRLKFNVSFNPDNRTYGNRDIEAAYQRYLPHIQRYAEAGLQVLIVFTHQLYGEGAGFDWRQMDGGRWRQLTSTYADFARQVAAKFAGTNQVHAYQIWNEQDTRPEHARAAVPMPPADYAHLLAESIRAIRQVDLTTPIITGGHTTGPEPGSQYARATLNALPPEVRPDGIAFHPYGRGVRGQRFSNFGSLLDSIDAYSAVLPGQAVWITEWGVLDHQGRADVLNDVLDYATGFMNLIRSGATGKVAAAIWYAWADSMDNGFGLVDRDGSPKPVLYEQWRTLG